MTIKIFAFFLISVVSVMLLSGCRGNNIIQGTGEMVSRSFQVDDFTGLDVGGSYDIIWRQDDNISVTIEMQENLFEYLEVSVQSGALHVSFARGIGIEFGGQGNRPRIYINSPNIEALNLRGASDAIDWDTIAVQHFTITASGASDINLHLEVESLAITASGAGNIELKGNSGTADITLSGAANVLARNLQIKDAKIIVSGAGNVDVTVSDNLDVTVSGAGDVRYTGNPSVTQNISGAGSLIKVD